MFRRQPVDVDHRRHPGIADREAADFSRGVQVALHGCRRDEEQIRDVVETAGDVVLRQQRGEVHLLRKRIEREQIANRVLILGTAQPMEQRQRTGIRLRDCRAIELGLEERRNGLVRRLIGPWRVDRRHRRGSQLPDNLLPKLGVCPDVAQILRVDHQPRDLRRRVVTGYAVPREYRPRRLLLGICGSRQSREQNRQHVGAFIILILRVSWNILSGP